MVAIRNTTPPRRSRDGAGGGGILAGALAIYRLTPGTHKARSIAAIGSLGVSIPAAVWFHAVENPQGFNQIMYSLVTYKQSGVWPKNTPNEVNTNELQKIVSENHTEEAPKSFELAQKTISKFISDDGNNFIDFITGIFDKYNIGSFTPPRRAWGYY